MRIVGADGFANCALLLELRETHLGQFASFTRSSVAIPTESTSADSKPAPLVSDSNSDNADDIDEADGELHPATGTNLHAADHYIQLHPPQNRLLNRQ